MSGPPSLFGPCGVYLDARSLRAVAHQPGFAVLYQGEDLEPPTKGTHVDTIDVLDDYLTRQGLTLEELHSPDLTTRRRLREAGWSVLKDASLRSLDRETSAYALSDGFTASDFVSRR